MPQPSSPSTPPNTEDTYQKEQAEGQELVLMEEGRMGEQQEKVVVTEDKEQIDGEL